MIYIYTQNGSWGVKGQKKRSFESAANRNERNMYEVYRLTGASELVAPTLKNDPVEY